MGDHGGQRKGEQKDQPSVTSRMKINKQGSSLISRIAKGGTSGTSYKDLLKQTLTLCSTTRQLLELHPTFGPCWSLYALVQLAMNNAYEARLSSSLATLTNSYLVESWIAWYACESGQGQTERMREI